MANAHIENLRVSEVIGSFDLRLADGEAVTILGPPRSGKTRLLRAVAGLDPIVTGRVLIDGTAVPARPIYQRRVAMVLRGFALYPHLDVEDNIAFPLRNRALSDDERREWIADLATQLELLPVLDHRPAELSAAQRLRVALARCLASSPRLLLLDDPLCSLPPDERQEMRVLMRRLQRVWRLTTIYSTSDSADAMALGDRIAFIADGHLHQTDTPTHLYTNPATSAVAAALGTPKINFLDAVLEEGSLRVANQAISLPEPISGHREIVVGIRPETFDINGDRRNSILAILDPSTRESLGSLSIVCGLVGDQAVFVQVSGNPIDVPRRAYAQPSGLLLFDRATGQRLR